MRKFFPRTDSAVMWGLIATLVLMASLGIYHSVRSYFLHKQSVESKTTEDALRVAQAFSVSMQYSAQMTKLVGEKAIAVDPKNLQAVREVLGDRYLTSKNTSDFFSWTFFDYITPENWLVVSTMHGVLAEPIDMSMREYVKRAPVEPWVVHFDPPAIGKTSKQWVIPAGMGITDAEGKYRGVISMGFNIAQIGERLEKALAHKGTYFALLNEKNQVVFASGMKVGPLPILEETLQSQLPPFGELKEEQGALEKNTGGKEKPYSQYQKIPGMPFFILMGYDPVMSSAELNQSIMLGTPQILLIGVFALVLIALLRHFVVKPIVELSNAADQISKDEFEGKIPRSRTYETNNLAKQLLKVKRLIVREKMMSEKIETMMELAQESDKAREQFMYDMHRALAVPLSALKGIAKLLKEEQLGPLSRKRYEHLFDTIEEATNQLETYTTDALFPTQVEIVPLIQQCMRVHQKQALHAEIKMHGTFEEEIPKLWADHLRIRQVILSCLYHSLQMLGMGREIHIYAYVETKKKQKYCVIRIEDNGIGATEAQRCEMFKFKEFVEKRKVSKIFVRDPDMTRLDFPVIRHLLALHGGSFSLEAKLKKGNKFTIRVPYLTEKELPPFSTLFEESAPKEKKTREKQKKAGNILPFPKNHAWK